MSSTSEVTSICLPQTGWILDSTFAVALGIQRETLPEWLKKYELPFSPLGNRILINLDLLYAALPMVNLKPEAEIQDGKKPEATTPAKSRNRLKDQANAELRT